MTEEALKQIIRTERRNSVIEKKARKMLEDIEGGNKICQLNRALYGLKQSGRQWHKRLNQELRNLGFTTLNSDPCVYSSNQGGALTLVVAYVDNILIISKNRNDIKKIGENLSKIFNIYATWVT